VADPLILALEEGASVDFDCQNRSSTYREFVCWSSLRYADSLVYLRIQAEPSINVLALTPSENDTELPISQKESSTLAGLSISRSTHGSLAHDPAITWRDFCQEQPLYRRNYHWDAGKCIMRKRSVSHLWKASAHM